MIFQFEVLSVHFSLHFEVNLKLLKDTEKLSVTIMVANNTLIQV